MGRNSGGSDEEGSNAISSGFHSIRDRFRFKRNPSSLPRFSKTPLSADRQWKAPAGGRSHYQYRSVTRKLLRFPFRGRSWFYLCVLLVIFVFTLASMVLQSSIMSVLRQGGSQRVRGRWSIRQDLKPGSSLEFVAPRRFEFGDGLEKLRSQPRIGVRRPRLALILGNVKRDPLALMLFTVMKNIKGLGYLLKIYAAEDGDARTMWEDIGGQVSILSPERYGYIDWSIFEGVIAGSLEAKNVISSLMQEPFCSVPLIWIIQEDILANRLQTYEDMGWENLISHWKNAFRRADVVVFPDFSLPMLYSRLDTGNFHVIPGSPLDVWIAESYSKTNVRNELRKANGFSEDDIVVLVVGSSLFYNDLSLDYALTMHDIEPLLIKHLGAGDSGEVFKFVFLCGNSTDGYDDALQVVDGVHGKLFSKHNPDALMKAFSLLISNGKLSKLAYSIASSAQLLAKNMLAEECVAGYAKLLENVLNFPSDVVLPQKASQLKQVLWEWGFSPEIEQKTSAMDNLDVQGVHPMNSNVVYGLEEDLTNLIPQKNVSDKNSEILNEDIPSKFDWDVLKEIEISEEIERLEMEEVEERMEKHIGEWDEIYRNARKAEKLKFETNERDEGELERTGQPLCIYEIYNGAGAWPFLHHGSLYRGLSLSTRARRLRSDDVDAVGRLPLLNDSHYRDILCEIGGMFSIANIIDNIHKRPWIGFQSWRASGKKVSLSKKAEQALEERIQKNTKGDIIYFWAGLDMDTGLTESNNMLTFWSMCDIMNAGNCRTVFQDAFRRMYALPSYIEALPPMPEDGGLWSALHSWVMPTPSFLEFMMFSRMFVDSLHALHQNSSEASDCLLGLSRLEKKYCYGRILEILVNVWAYHSGRKMVFVDPHSGLSEEQHPIEQRTGFMWAKYFNTTLLKAMDEDLAEAADDNDHPYEAWLWPLTGEVYWQGIYEREREERYRLKMDKKRKTKEKLLERMKYGYKQKTLGG